MDDEGAPHAESMEVVSAAPVMARAFLRKPLAVVRAEENESKLERHLSIFDLLCIGIGGTVGSGVFVLCGLIANKYAGPGVVLSWIISGVGCVFSGMNYAELSSRIPSAGSSYAYAFVALGELPAVVAGWCLTLEYGVSAAAVARSWGEKLVLWVEQDLEREVWAPLHTENVNVLAAAMTLLCMGVLLGGVSVGKTVTNFFTVLKMALVLFMIFGGFALFNPSNLRPFAPNGAGGILRGATSSFFGYLGYDEVACLAAEAKDPQRSLPIAVGGTILGVSVLYVLSALALVGMQDSASIDPDSGFSQAFGAGGWAWAQHLVAAGELATLPLVVLISFLAQPRLQFAMAEDGLLPSIFARLDRSGNLFHSILLTGLVVALVALFVPFRYLDDMISAGVLVAFNITNASLVVLRRRHPTKQNACAKLMAAHSALSFLAAVLWQQLLDGGQDPSWAALPAIVTIAALVPLASVSSTCPEVNDGAYAAGFRVPCVPFLPAIGIFINWYLVAQLEWYSLLMIAAYIAAAMLWYVVYGLRNSVGNRDGWRAKLEQGRSDAEVPDSITDTLLLQDASQM